MEWEDLVKHKMLLEQELARVELMEDRAMVRKDLKKVNRRINEVNRRMDEISRKHTMKYTDESSLH